MELPARPAPLPARVALVCLELFTAVGALYGGGTLITDPTGQSIGFTLEMLRGTPFPNYLWPGIVLFTVNGLGMLAVALTVALKWRRSTAASLAVGTLLAGWIVVQVLMLGYVSFFQPMMFAIGVLIAGVSILAGRPSGAAGSGA